jgi:hypothetical protein
MARLQKPAQNNLKCHSEAGRKNDKGTKQRCYRSAHLLAFSTVLRMYAARLEVLGSREVVVFKGPFNPVLGHAIGIRGDTECYISSGGPVLVVDRNSEAL